MDNHSNLALITSPASTMKVRNISVLSLLFLSFFSNLAFAVNNPPQVGTITPSSGSSQPEVLNSVTTTYTDPDGWRNLQYANLLVNASAITKTNCFYGYYNQNTNKLYLRNDADTAWLGGYLPGSANTIENSYAKLNCAQTTVSGSGTTLTVQWAVTFKQPFTGAKKTYLYVRDDANAYNGWTQKGTWAIVNQPPLVGAIVPSSGASEPNQGVSFTTTYFDPNEWLNLQSVYLLVNASTAKTNCFYGYYNQNTNKLYLRNDADTAWLGGYLPGSANTIENSYAKLNCAQTTVSGSGTTLTVQWAVTFKQPFTGAKKTYLYVRDDANAYNGWTQKGTWAINNPPIITQIIPANNATFTEGDSIVISATAQDPNGNPLEYQFSIDGQIVRTWSSLNTFNWQTQTGDIHLKTITVEARDSYQGTASGQTQVFLYRRVPSP